MDMRKIEISLWGLLLLAAIVLVYLGRKHYHVMYPYVFVAALIVIPIFLIIFFRIFLHKLKE